MAVKMMLTEYFKKCSTTGTLGHPPDD